MPASTSRSVFRSVGTTTPIPPVAPPGSRLTLQPVYVNEYWANSKYTVTVCGDAITPTGHLTLSARIRRGIARIGDRLPQPVAGLLPSPMSFAEFGDHAPNPIGALPDGVLAVLAGPAALAACAKDFE